MKKQQEILLSVVIPVHNGEKFIEKTVKNILKQSYRNLEVILVENNSRDRSWDIVCGLQRTDARVKAVQSNMKGTSLARHRGVEEASGKYIVFSDQDDCHSGRHSLAYMVQSIHEDGSQICQFNHYVKYHLAPLPFGVQKKKKQVKKDCVITREQLLKTEIGGVLGTQQGSMFNTQVWNKIYDAAMLKEAVKNIEKSLYFSEDMFLNFWAFTNQNTRNISARTKGVYVWTAGVGFSSQKNSGEALFRDYEQTKPVMLPILEEQGVDPTVLWNNHLETLYAIKAYVKMMSAEKDGKTNVIEKLETILNYKYVKNAQKYIRENQHDKIWEELLFMAEEHTAEEFYQRFASC